MNYASLAPKPVARFLLALTLTASVGHVGVAYGSLPYEALDAAWPASVCKPDLMQSGADYFTTTGQLENQATAARTFHCPLSTRSEVWYDAILDDYLFKTAPHGDVYLEVYDHTTGDNIECTMYRRWVSRSTYATYSSSSASDQTSVANAETDVLVFDLSDTHSASNAIYYYHVACDMPAGTGSSGSRLNAFYAPGW